MRSHGANLENSEIKLNSAPQFSNHLGACHIICFEIGWPIPLEMRGRINQHTSVTALQTEGQAVLNTWQNKSLSRIFPSFLFPQLHLTFTISFILQKRETSVGCCCMGAIDCFSVCLNVNIWISEWACKYIWGIFVHVTDSLCCADSGNAGCGLCIRWPWWLWSVWTRIMRRLLTGTRWNR